MVGKKIDLPFFGQNGLVSRTVLPELSPCYTLGCGEVDGDSHLGAEISVRDLLQNLTTGRIFPKVGHAAITMVLNNSYLLLPTPSRAFLAGVASRVMKRKSKSTTVIQCQDDRLKI